MPKVNIADLPGVEIGIETTRRNLAYGSLFGFLGIIATIVFIGWLWKRIAIDDVLKILTTTTGMLSGIVGAVVGFYFRGDK
jgi:ABC-type xylose transport system permease subunit